MITYIYMSHWENKSFVYGNFKEKAKKKHNYDIEEDEREEAKGGKWTQKKPKESGKRMPLNEHIYAVMHACISRA